MGGAGLNCPGAGHVPAVGAPGGQSYDDNVTAVVRSGSGGGGDMGGHGGGVVAPRAQASFCGKLFSWKRNRAKRTNKHARPLCRATPTACKNHVLGRRLRVSGGAECPRACPHAASIRPVHAHTGTALYPRAAPSLALLVMQVVLEASTLRLEGSVTVEGSNANKGGDPGIGTGVGGGGSGGSVVLIISEWMVGHGTVHMGGGNGGNGHTGSNGHTGGGGGGGSGDDRDDGAGGGGAGGVLVADVNASRLVDYHTLSVPSVVIAGGRGGEGCAGGGTGGAGGAVPSAGSVALSGQPGDVGFVMAKGCPAGFEATLVRGGAVHAREARAR